MKTKQPLAKLKPNFWLLLLRAWRLCRQNIWRNKLITLATVLVMAVMIFIFNAVMVVNLITNQALNGLNEKVNLVFYLTDDIALYQANELQESLKKVPGVKSVRFVSKEDALKVIESSYPETADFFKRFQLENPLPPSISINTTTPQDFQNVKTVLESEKYQRYLQDEGPKGSSDQQIISATANNLISINNFVQQLIWGIITVFLLGSVLIVVNAIQLTVFTRRQEIKIMRLVGATNAFIRWPYLLEGAVYACLAMILSAGFLTLTVYGLNLENLLFRELPAGPDFLIVFVAELGLTILLSVLCSAATLQNYLRKQNL